MFEYVAVNGLNMIKPFLFSMESANRLLQMLDY